jgi:hypothetical protein
MWVALVAAVLWLVYGLGFLGYDAGYWLVWGRDIAHGHTPGLRDPIGPTAHPLAILVATVLSPLGDAAAQVLSGLSLFAFALLGWAAFRLGRQLFSPAIGLVFALALLTRPTLVSGTYQSGVDVPFLAFVLVAAGIEARRPRCGYPVLFWLGAAGLLRPEGWLLAGLYLAYIWIATGSRPPYRAFALALAAPLAWMVFDLVLTGDPLFSLHETRDIAERLERPRSLPDAFALAPTYLRKVLHPLILWTGLGGSVLALGALRRRAVLPGVMFLAGLVPFLVLGTAGLPLRPRYLILPAGMTALFFAVALLGWQLLPLMHPGRGPWLMASAALAVLALVVSLPSEAGRLRDLVASKDERGAVQDALHDVATSALVRASVRGCGPLYAPGYRTVPLLAWWLHVDPPSLILRTLVEPDRGTLIVPATHEVLTGSLFHPSELVRRRFDVPTRFAPLAADGSWTAASSCAQINRRAS